MSLLSVTVKKARFVGAQTAQWNCYATLKLQHVKSTTVTVKGATPSWEQDFLFEINNLDTGLIIEVWNKGLIWDKAVGYHWLHLRDIHYSNFAGAGQWLALEAEQVMRDGEVVGTKFPTGHSLLVDARFELPLGAVEGDEAVELQRKLEILNSMLDKEARAEHSRRQHQYYIQCESGVSEDSDYTSDVNYPVGQHPNSSASQFLTAANQLTTPQRSLNSSRENSYEKDDEYRSGNHTDPYLQHPGYGGGGVRTTPRRLPQPQTKSRQLQQQQEGYWEDGSLPRDTETEPLYYNSRPQTQNSRSYRRRDTGANDEYGYGEDLSYSRRQYGDNYNYDSAQENYPATGAQKYSLRQKNGRREMPSLERQDTLYSESGDYGNEGYSTKQLPAIPVPAASQYSSAQVNYYSPSSTQPLNSSSIYNQQESNHPQQYVDQYGQNGHGSTLAYEDAVDATAVPPKQTVHAVVHAPAPGIQKNYSYEEWNHVGDSNSRDQPQYSSSSAINKKPAAASVAATAASFISSPISISSMLVSKTAALFKSKPAEPAAAATTPKVVPPDPTFYPTSKFGAAGTAAAQSKSQYHDSMYNTSADAHAHTQDPSGYGYGNGNSVAAAQYGHGTNTTTNAPSIAAAPASDPYANEIGYENWDYSSGYYDEAGNFIPFENQDGNYYDASGNLVQIPSQGDGYDEYYGQGYENPASDYYWPEEGGEYYDDHGQHETDQNYRQTATSTSTTAGKTKLPVQPQPSVEYNYAYQSAENLSPVDGKSAKKPVTDTGTGVVAAGVERLNSISRRASFRLRRQTSTRDYATDGAPPAKQQTTADNTNSTYQTAPGAKVNGKTVGAASASSGSVYHSADRGYSLEDEGHYTGSEWASQSQDYADAEDGEGTYRSDSYDAYEDAHAQDTNGQNVEGPVHMDSLDSNTSDPNAPRDAEANEKFEAQYWQRQRERIASQSTLQSQGSEEYYNYEPTYPANGNAAAAAQIASTAQPNTDKKFGTQGSISAAPGQGLKETLAAVAQSRQGSLEEQYPEEAENLWLDSRHGSIKSRKDASVEDDVWLDSRHGSVKARKDAAARQEALDSHPEEDAEFLIGDEDGRLAIRVRKQSTLSVDSQGEPLPPTTPPPGGTPKTDGSLDDDTMAERKSSLDVPGKDKGKTVSFDEEPPKVCRQTTGMTSKEKWLWSMNRICSQLGVS